MTRYDLFRRRIAPILFLALVALIMYDAWKKEKREGISGTVVIELGEARPRVRACEAELYVNGDTSGVPADTFRLNALPDAMIGACRFKTHLPSPDAELRVMIDDAGRPRRFTRAVHIEDGATVQVDLGRELEAPPSPTPISPPS